jgi:PAS domain S-box-containing protein
MSEFKLLYEGKAMHVPVRSTVPASLSGPAAFAVDLHGVVRYCNAVAEVLTGWSTKDALNRPLASVFELAGAVPRWQPRGVAQEAMDNDRAVNPATYGLLRNRTERELLVEYSATPIHCRDGRVTGAMIVFRDVTWQLDLHPAPVV